MHGTLRPTFGQVVLYALCVVHLAASSSRAQERSKPPRKPNVLLVVIDTLRADRLGCYGYKRATSPAIDALAERGTLFERSYSYSDGTIHSHLALFSSQYVQRFSGARPGKMLAEVFAVNGYRTYGLSANPLLLPFRNFAWGFHYYTHCPVSPELAGLAVSGTDFNQQTEMRSAAETTKAVLAALRGHRREHGDKPWFLFVNYLDPHDPYTERKPWSDVFRRSASTISGRLREGGARTLWSWIAKVLPTLSKADIDRLGELYDAEIRYTDEQIARVLGFLEDVGWRDNTIVVITSDHGEVLGEYENMFTHMLACYETELAVPLIIQVPWFDWHGVRSGDLVESVDVAPTLLRLCGIDPPREFVGRALVGPTGRLIATGRTFTRHFHWAISKDERRELGFPEESLSDCLVVRTEGRKLYIPRGGGKPKLFDISSPPERKEIHDRRAIEQMIGLIGAAPEPKEGATTQPADPALLRALRSLGYTK